MPSSVLIPLLGLSVPQSKKGNLGFRGLLTREVVDSAHGKHRKGSERALLKMLSPRSHAHLRTTVTLMSSNTYQQALKHPVGADQ